MRARTRVDEKGYELWYLEGSVVVGLVQCAVCRLAYSLLVVKAYAFVVYYANATNA